MTDGQSIEIASEREYRRILAAWAQVNLSYKEYAWRGAGRYVFGGYNDYKGDIATLEIVRGSVVKRMDASAPRFVAPCPRLSRR